MKEREGKKVRATYKAISARFARLSIGDDHRLFNVAKCLEEGTQRLVGGVVRQTAYEDL